MNFMETFLNMEGSTQKENSFPRNLNTVWSLIKTCNVDQRVNVGKCFWSDSIFVLFSITSCSNAPHSFGLWKGHWNFSEFDPNKKGNIFALRLFFSNRKWDGVGNLRINRLVLQAFSTFKEGGRGSIYSVLVYLTLRLVTFLSLFPYCF